MQGRPEALYGKMRGVLTGIEDHREGASEAEQQRAADLGSDHVRGQQRGIAMSNRQQRRASLAAFRREAAGGYLDVYLVPTDAPINNPLLERAASH
jgi:hypothetical protein